MWGDKGLPDLQIRALGEEWSHDKEYVGGEQTEGITMQREETTTSTTYGLQILKTTLSFHLVHEFYRE